MSQAGRWITNSGGGGAVLTVTSNAGGAVSPTGLGNIFLVGGNNITGTGNPGTNTVTFSVTGTTNHAVQVGNATGSLTSIAVGATGQYLTGVTGADPVWSAIPAGGAITFHTDAADATVAASAITIHGTNGITTSGAGSTVTISGSAFAQTITGDSGGALAPTAGNWNITGGTTGLTFAGAVSTETLTGTLAVKNGGTSNTTFTAYSVITAGTTAQGAFQNVVGVGTSGQVLTSQGAAALPQWTTLGGSTISITGDTGGAITSGTFTFTGGTTGLSFGGAGTTETLTFAGITANNGTVSLATDATTSTINIGTGAGAKTTTLGSTNTTSTTTINSGTGNVNINSPVIVYDGISAGYSTSQWRTAQVGVQTTDATPTTIVSLAVADSQMISIKAYINGFRSTFGDSIGAEVFMTVYRSTGGNVALVGTPVVNTVTTSTSDVTCTVNTGTQVALIQVTGVAAQTFNWVATYQYMYTNTNA